MVCVSFGNVVYVQMAEVSMVRQAYYSNANNTGNVMDVLSWFALNV